MAPDTVDRTEPQLEEGVWTRSPEGDLVPDYDATFPTINEGEVVHGTVVRVDKDEVLVDIGYKSEGVIPVSELSIRRSVNPQDEVALGDEVDALVLTKEDAEGRLILSKKRARFELAWKTIEQKAETGEPIVGRVIEVVKGGPGLRLVGFASTDSARKDAPSSMARMSSAMTCEEMSSFWSRLPSKPVRRASKLSARGVPRVAAICQ